MTDEYYMKQALKLAKKGEGFVSPNPMVGAVIVKNDSIIAAGYHKFYGGPHAETNAVHNASEKIDGSTIYVTLEPCSHHGKTPPCAEFLVRQKPARIVVGTLDPNPLVSGRGIEILKKNGIEVTIGVLDAECRNLNKKFFKFVQTGIPYVTVRYAQTMDGRIATATGHSRWVSSLSSRRYSHRLRATHDAILVGRGTVSKDNPDLTVRLVKGRNPLRVVLDSSLKTALDSQIYANQAAAKTVIAITGKAEDARRASFNTAGIDLIDIEENSEGRISLENLLAVLGKRGISSLLVEGGAELTTSFIRESLADALIIIIAPKIIGAGIAAIGDLEIRNMEDAFQFKREKVLYKDGDLIFEGTLLRR